MSPEDQTDRRCQKLWWAVVEQAVKDALWQDPLPDRPLTDSHADEGRRNQVVAGVQARRWFLNADSGYRRICAMALLDHEAVRDRIRAELAKRPVRKIEVGA